MSTRAAVEVRERRRCAVVGVGSRAEFYVSAMTTTYAADVRIVAWCDPNPTRMAVFDQVATAAGAPAPAHYRPEAFATLLAEHRPQLVLVTSPDFTHHGYVIAALEAGCDVIVEKPLTTELEPAQQIARAAASATGRLAVSFNYRYSPRNSELRRILGSGAIGQATSVHFEWALDTVHGADYFRRWHRNKAMSGGLLVHKSSHHFDLVNWWLGDVARTVYATGGLRFYGAENAAARGMHDRPTRSTGWPGAVDDPFSLDLRRDDRLRRLYLDAEGDDGYVRDLDVFSPGITIEDNLGLAVTYESGAILTYSLNAHSPWEGYRVSVNGTEGRAELDVVERGHAPRASAAEVVGGRVVDPSAQPDVRAATTRHDPRPAGTRLILQRHWEQAEEVAVAEGEGGHGGGDSLLLNDLFRPSDAADPLGRAAGYRDGLRSVAVGIAGNRSLATGQAVAVADLDLPLQDEERHPAATTPRR
jgi:predicted dehydrogenase